jgi:hypothetical protein
LKLEEIISANLLKAAYCPVIGRYMIFLSLMGKERPALRSFTTKLEDILIIKIEHICVILVTDAGRGEGRRVKSQRDMENHEMSWELRRNLIWDSSRRIFSSFLLRR